MSLPPHVAHIISVLQPRKPKQRTTVIALLILLCLSSYIFIGQSTTLSPALAIRRSDSAAADQLALAVETIRNSRLSDVSSKHSMRKGHHHFKTPLKLDTAEELAAVTSFLASLPQNVIPHTVDPSLPIDPQLVLDFDTRGPRAREEVKAIVEEVWLRNPIFLYSKVSSTNWVYLSLPHLILAFMLGLFPCVAGTQKHPCRSQSQACTHNHGSRRS